MLFSKINHTNLSASKLVLGTASYGTYINREDSFQLLDRFTELGGNIIDTALVYSDWADGEKSASEKTIGRWMNKRNNRKDMIISTKGGHHDIHTSAPRLNTKCITEDLQKSLENLQTDYIDIYWLHKDDVNQDPEELIEMLNESAPQQYAHYYGVSNWTYDRIKKANAHAAKKGLRPIIASQIMYSIAEVNYVDAGILAMDNNEYEKYCTDDLSLFGFSSQARGFFAIMAANGEEALPPSAKRDFINERNLKILERLNETSIAKNVTVSDLVLATLVGDKKLNTFAQIGPKNVAELEVSVQSMNVSLTEKERNYILAK